MVYNNFFVWFTMAYNCNINDLVGYKSELVLIQDEIL